MNFLNVPENSFKTLLFWSQLWFLSRTGKTLHREETNQVKVLESKFLQKKASFLLFPLKEIKLIDDSFGLSVSICVLKQCI